MNKIFIPALVAASLFSASAFADNGWGGHDNKHWKHRKHQHQHVQQVMVPRAYVAPVVVYEPAPVVVYRERIVYRDRPVYYEAEPRYYEQPAAYGGGNRLLGQTLGAIAGGALGTQVGQGNGRIAATAIGAVVGGALGGHAAGY